LFWQLINKYTVLEVDYENTGNSGILTPLFFAWKITFNDLSSLNWAGHNGLTGQPNGLNNKIPTKIL
jgi:hypothetical protein